MNGIRKALENFGRIEERNGSIFVISSFFFPGSDESLALCINQIEDGRYLLSDCGSTVDYLEIEDVDLASYQENLKRILERFNVTFDGKVFRKTTGSDSEVSLKLCLGYFIQALSLIANIDFFDASKEESPKEHNGKLKNVENFLQAEYSEEKIESSGVDVLKTFEKGLDLLDRYDHQTLEKPIGRPATFELSFEECRRMIDSMSFGDSSEVFGVEKGEGKLDGILKNVEQEVFGEKVYPTVEEKASHLLYYLVKDHPFVDGCKRISATLFLEYLNKNGILKRDGKLIISNETIASLTILVAESRADEKDLMIKLIMNIIK